MPPEPFLSRAARWLTFASAVAIVFSIAVSQIFLALALAALLLSGEKLRLPRIWLPLGLFMLGTLISLAFSGDPVAGLPQVRKFYVFSELLVVYSALRDSRMIRWLFLTWAGFASITAIRGFVQFANKIQEAHRLGRDFYTYYVSERITGFMSHWNTFAAQEMFALLMLAAFLFFAPGARRRTWIWILCAALMSFAAFLGMTRAVWIGIAVGGVYLLWFWKRWFVAAIPVVLVLAFLLSPHGIRERFTSLVRPQKDVDSNQFRVVTARTGLVMIARHPFLGLGPEGVKLHFDDYVPADIPRPLPTGWYGHLHSIYLHYAAERGIPTALMLMWMLGLILYDFLRGLRSLPPGRSDRRFLLHGGVAVLLATLAEGFFELNLGDSEVLTMFLVVVACGYLALEKDVFGAA
jgi:O-antigen ligase